MEGKGLLNIKSRYFPQIKNNKRGKQRKEKRGMDPQDSLLGLNGPTASSGSGDKSQAGPRRQDRTVNTQRLRNTQMKPRSPSSAVYLLLPPFSPWPLHPPPQFLPKTNRKGRLERKKEARKARVGEGKPGDME